MGLQGSDWEQNKEALVNAMSNAKVSVYIPSEFGTYHYVSNYRSHPMFKLKAHHFEESKKKDSKSSRRLYRVDDGTSVLQAPWFR